MRFYFTINGEKYSCKSVQDMRKGIEHYQAKGARVDRNSIGITR